jgi:hypothetical protein
MSTERPALGRLILIATDYRWDLTLAMTANASLADNVRQIAILVVGARFDAAYELYAHIAVAEREGMKPERLAAPVADLKPRISLKKRMSLSISLTSWCGAGPCQNRFTVWRSTPLASTELMN